MSVSVDGVPRYRFAVSTGRAGHGTPNGTYHPQHLAASWFSKLYYNSPMHAGRIDAPLADHTAKRPRLDPALGRACLDRVEIMRDVHVPERDRQGPRRLAGHQREWDAVGSRQM
jgi:hypothetical protein